jgi:hypothetical protein
MNRNDDIHVIYRLATFISEILASPTRMNLNVYFGVYEGLEVDAQLEVMEKASLKSRIYMMESLRLIRIR